MGLDLPPQVREGLHSVVESLYASLLPVPTIEDSTGSLEVVGGHVSKDSESKSDKSPLLPGLPEVSNVREPLHAGESTESQYVAASRSVYVQVDESVLKNLVIGVDRAVELLLRTLLLMRSESARAGRKSMIKVLSDDQLCDLKLSDIRLLRSLHSIRNLAYHEGRILDRKLAQEVSTSSIRVLRGYLHKFFGFFLEELVPRSLLGRVLWEMNRPRGLYESRMMGNAWGAYRLRALAQAVDYAVASPLIWIRNEVKLDKPLLPDQLIDYICDSDSTQYQDRDNKENIRHHLVSNVELRFLVNVKDLTITSDKSYQVLHFQGECLTDLLNQARGRVVVQPWALTPLNEMPDFPKQLLTML